MGVRLRARWVTFSILAVTIGCVSLALSAMTRTPPQPRYAQGVWRVTRSTSRHPKPITTRICLNELAPPDEMRTCAGRVAAPYDFGTSVRMSCVDLMGKTSMSITGSRNGGFLRERVEFAPDPRMMAGIPPGPPLIRGEAWVQSTMTYEGACPVTMRDDQPLLFVKPDGTTADPFRATKCMVDVLKTVDGVTEPKSGWARDPGRGWLLFVRYSYPRRHDYKPVEVSFTANAEDVDSPHRGGFIASIGGVFTPGEDGPDDLGADQMIKLWHDRCGVDAGIEYP